MVRLDVVHHMADIVAPLSVSIPFDTDALGIAADYMEAAYGKPYADMTRDARWFALTEFFAINALLNYAAGYFKFSADNATIEANNIFTQLNARWHNALAMAQTYLTEAGMMILVPGAPIPPRNYGWRAGSYNTNYLAEGTGAVL